MPDGHEPLHLESELIASDGTPSAAGHQWKQRGPYLVCTSCPREHGISITAFGARPTDIYIGMDEDGKPRFNRL